MSDGSEEMLPCPHCGTPAPPDADFCPHCGERLKVRSTGSFIVRSCLYLVVFLIAVLVALCGTCFLFVGIGNMQSTNSWSYALGFTLLGAGLLFVAFYIERAARRMR